MGIMAMRVLFLGGTGVISYASVRLAAERGYQVTVVNRGRTGSRPVPDGVEVLTADVRDQASLAAAVAGRTFDTVCDFLSFTPDHLEQSLRVLDGATGQYIFVSSASAYQTPVRRLPITESTPLANPYWQYSRDKIACEELLVRRWRDEQFPVTIVRPSHTYDQTMTILGGRHAMLRRLLRGDEVIVHGDGTSLWTLTHSSDFAQGFVGLVGHAGAFGQAVHITSDEWLTWDEIVACLARAAQVEPRIVHVPSDAIHAADPDWGDGLLGDKANCTIFDNSLIRRLVPGFACQIPFSVGAHQIVAYHREHTAQQPRQAETEQTIAALLERYRISQP